MAGTAGMRGGLGGRCRRDRRHPRILHPPAQLPQPPDGGPVGLQQLGRVVLELREQEVEVLQRRRGRHREAGRDPSGRVGHRLLGLLDLLWRDRCPASDPRRDRPPPRGAKPPLWPEVVRLSYPRGQQPEQGFGPGRMPSGKGRPRAVDAGERGLGRPARHNASAATAQPEAAEVQIACDQPSKTVVGRGRVNGRAGGVHRPAELLFRLPSRWWQSPGLDLVRGLCDDGL
jgi:hypothetical protein